MTAHAFPTGTILGYPRIGRRRELKRAVEAFWAGTIDAAELEARAAELRAATRERLAALGSRPRRLVDPRVVLVLRPGARRRGRRRRRARAVPAPRRTTRVASTSPGTSRSPAARATTRPLEMTKWFDSNYHYLVPEIGPDTAFTLHADRILAEFAEAKAAGFLTRPVIVGPVTFLLLAKAADGAPSGFRPIDRLDDLVPVYAELLVASSRAAGAEWVQLDEPALVSESIDEPRDRVLDAIGVAYDALGSAERIARRSSSPRRTARSTTPCRRSPRHPSRRSASTSCAARLPERSDPATEESLASKTLVAGVIDGHNIWRGDLAARLRACRRAPLALVRRRRVDLDVAAARAARRRRRDRRSTRAS